MIICSSHVTSKLPTIINESNRDKERSECIQFTPKLPENWKRTRTRNNRIKNSSKQSDKNLYTHLNDVSQMQRGSDTPKRISIPSLSISGIGNGIVTETK